MDETKRVLRTYRPQKVQRGRFMLRDQKPMRLPHLKRNLEGSNLTAEDWFELLNERVFFAMRSRFVSDLRKSYLSEPVTILSVDTLTLLNRHRAKVEVSSKNNGATRMPTHWKSRASFQRIEDVTTERLKLKELTVCHSVPDIREMDVNVYEVAAGQDFASSLTGNG
ncbi:MAG: hypothetical protein V4555_09615 [Acidobacteriota bacterium]